MENKIYYISEKELPAAKQNDGRIKRVFVDLKQVHSYNAFIEILAKELAFPTPLEGIHARYMDWMRDLLWLDYEGYEIYLYNIDAFAHQSHQSAYQLYKDFEEYILPFWEYQVPFCVVDGRPKPFSLYIVGPFEYFKKVYNEQAERDTRIGLIRKDPGSDKIYYTKQSEVANYYKGEATRVKNVTIDMKEITDIDGFYEKMATEFSFPEAVNGSHTRYLAHIRDLSWLDCEECNVFIYNIDDFTNREPVDAYILSISFEDYIIPWWQEPRFAKTIVQKDFKVFFMEPYSDFKKLCEGRSEKDYWRG